MEIRYKKSGLQVFLVALFLIVAIFSIDALSVEYSHDAQVGDFVKVVLQNESTFQGTLVEQTEDQLILESSEGRTVLQESSIAEILVLPRQGDAVRLTMTDGTTHDGRWAGQDERNVYLNVPQGKATFDKSNVKRVEVVARQSDTTPSESQSTSTEKQSARRQGTEDGREDASNMNILGGTLFGPFGVGYAYFANVDIPQERQEAIAERPQDYQENYIEGYQHGRRMQRVTFQLIGWAGWVLLIILL